MSEQKVFRSMEGKNAILKSYDSLLQRASSNYSGKYERLTVKTRFGDTFVLATGKTDTPPLVLLHGSSMNSIMWAKDMQAFAKDYRVYAPDMPGEPGRSVERQLPFDASDYVDWLVDVFDGLSINTAILGGASLGAWLSIKFAIEYPERVDLLILLCPAGVGSQNHAFKDIALSLLSQGEKGVDALLTQINGAPIPEVMLNYQKLIATVFNSRQEPIPMFSDEDLSSISVPSALFFGENDIMLDPTEAVERFSKLVPNATVSLILGKGHSLTGLTDEIMRFVKSRQQKDRNNE